MVREEDTEISSFLSEELNLGLGVGAGGGGVSWPGGFHTHHLGDFGQIALCLCISILLSVNWETAHT